MTPPVKPWKIVALEPGRALVKDRATGEVVGSVVDKHGWGDSWVGFWLRDGLRLPGSTLTCWTRAEAAALVYQAWLDRTSEGSKK